MREPELHSILQELSARLGESGEPEPLDGGITNRNYRVTLGRRAYVLRLVGAQTELLGISREAERLAGETAAELGIGPAVVAAGEGFLLTEFVPCRPVDPEALRADPSGVAGALRAFHGSGLRLPARFWVPDLLERYAGTVARRGGELPSDWRPAAELARRIAVALPLDAPVPCHDDLLGANLLAPDSSPGSVLLVDWEYAGMGHRLFDLGNLSVNNGFDEAADDRLLTAYFGTPPSGARRAGLALMRLLSDIREAAWGVVQSAVSALDFDFDGYAGEHFERLRVAAGDHRLEGWLDAATA